MKAEQGIQNVEDGPSGVLHASASGGMKTAQAGGITSASEYMDGLYFPRSLLSTSSRKKQQVRFELRLLNSSPYPSDG